MKILFYLLLTLLLQSFIIDSALSSEKSMNGISLKSLKTVDKLNDELTDFLSSFSPEKIIDDSIDMSYLSRQEPKFECAKKAQGQLDSLQSVSRLEDNIDISNKNIMTIRSFSYFKDYLDCLILAHKQTEESSVRETLEYEIVQIVLTNINTVSLADSAKEVQRIRYAFYRNQYTYAKDLLAQYHKQDPEKSMSLISQLMSSWRRYFLDDYLSLYSVEMPQGFLPDEMKFTSGMTFIGESAGFIRNLLQFSSWNYLLGAAGAGSGLVIDRIITKQNAKLLGPPVELSEFENEEIQVLAHALDEVDFYSKLSSAGGLAGQSIGFLYGYNRVHRVTQYAVQGTRWRNWINLGYTAKAILSGTVLGLLGSLTAETSFKTLSKEWSHFRALNKIGSNFKKIEKLLNLVNVETRVLKDREINEIAEALENIRVQLKKTEVYYDLPLYLESENISKILSGLTSKKFFDVDEKELGKVLKSIPRSLKRRDMDYGGTMDFTTLSEMELHLSEMNMETISFRDLINNEGLYSIWSRNWKYRNSICQTGAIRLCLYRPTKFKSSVIPRSSWVSGLTKNNVVSESDLKEKYVKWLNVVLDISDGQTINIDELFEKVQKAREDIESRLAKYIDSTPRLGFSNFEYLKIQTQAKLKQIKESLMKESKMTPNEVILVPMLEDLEIELFLEIFDYRNEWLKYIDFYQSMNSSDQEGE